MRASLQVGLLLRQPVLSPSPRGWPGGPFQNRLPLRAEDQEEESAALR